MHKTYSCAKISWKRLMGLMFCCTSCCTSCCTFCCTSCPSCPSWPSPLALPSHSAALCVCAWALVLLECSLTVGIRSTLTPCPHTCVYSGAHVRTCTRAHAHTRARACKDMLIINARQTYCEAHRTCAFPCAFSCAYNTNTDTNTGYRTALLARMHAHEDHCWCGVVCCLRLHAQM